MPESSGRLDLHLSFPSSASYRGVAGELAEKLAEYAGAAAGDAKQLAKDVDAAVAALAAADGDGTIDLVTARQPRALVVTASAGSGTRESRCSLPD